MNVGNIIAISITCAFIYLIVWIVIINRLSRVIYAKKVESTYSAFFGSDSKIGLIVYLIGKQGAGKTTLGAGLANLTAVYMEKLAQKTLNDIRNSYPKMPWQMIDDLIGVAYNESTNWLSILNFVIYNLKDNVEFAKFINTPLIETYLFPKNPRIVLQDYIEAKTALIRDNYIYYKGRKFYSRVNGKWAMNFDNELIKLTNNYFSGDYHLLKFVALFEDEKTLTARNKGNGYNENNGGSYLFSEFIRHLGNEGGKIRYFTTTQRAGRVNIQERELSMTTLKINNRKELFNFDFELQIIKAIQPQMVALEKSINQIREAFYAPIILYFKRKSALAMANNRKKDFANLSMKYLKTADKIERIKENPTLISRLLNFATKRQKYIYSNGFLKYETTAFFDIDQKGNYSGQGEKFNLVLPLSWCFGSVDTYQYRFIDEALAEKALEKNYEPLTTDIADLEIPNFKALDNADLDNIFYRKKTNKQKINDEFITILKELKA